MLTPDIRKKAEAKHLTLHALMTLASMVEREARFKEDQVPIASVMLKRLEIGMPLQIDATIQYALGSPKEELTIADTRIDSPTTPIPTTACRRDPSEAPAWMPSKRCWRQSPVSICTT